MDTAKMVELMEDLRKQQVQMATAYEAEDEEPTEHEIVVKILGYIVNELHEIKEKLDAIETRDEC
jgi:hypothetical protein